MPNGRQNSEPRTALCEIVHVGRRWLLTYDVTIFYKLVGRGKFHVDGGTIFQEKEVSGGKQLTIVTNRGHTFDIIRKSSTSGGVYELLTAGFWTSVKEPVVVQVT
ncbi:hypothetical protein ABFA07_017956 [Porites harrisoni]